jgi:probable phosphoglycerate mutase
LNIVQGSGVDTVLNEKGLKQASAFYKAYHQYPFDKVYTSVLRRSVQSVQGFIEKGIPHEALEELNEISWGDFEGKEQTTEQRDIYWSIVKRWNSGDEHASIPNGESPTQLRKRQTRALERILAQSHEKKVLICMHGRAMKSLLCLILGHPPSKMEEFPHNNLCLYVIKEIGNGQFELTVQNDISHLNS